MQHDPDNLFGGGIKTANLILEYDWCHGGKCRRKNYIQCEWKNDIVSAGQHLAIIPVHLGPAAAGPIPVQPVAYHFVRTAEMWARVVHETAAARPVVADQRLKPATTHLAFAVVDHSVAAAGVASVRPLTYAVRLKKRQLDGWANLCESETQIALYRTIEGHAYTAQESDKRPQHNDQMIQSNPGPVSFDLTY